MGRISTIMDETLCQGLGQIAQLPEVAEVAERGVNQERAQCMVKFIQPLCIQSVSTLRNRMDQTDVVQIAFRDDVNAPSELTSLLMNRCSQLLQYVAGAEVEDAVHRIQPKRVHMKFGDPVECILNKKAADAVTVGAVKVESVSPRSPVRSIEERREDVQVVAFRP